MGFANEAWCGWTVQEKECVGKTEKRKREGKKKEERERRQEERIMGRGKQRRCFPTIVQSHVVQGVMGEGPTHRACEKRHAPSTRELSIQHRAARQENSGSLADPSLVDGRPAFVPVARPCQKSPSVHSCRRRQVCPLSQSACGSFRAARPAQCSCGRHAGNYRFGRNVDRPCRWPMSQAPCRSLHCVLYFPGCASPFPLLSTLFILSLCSLPTPPPDNTIESTCGCLWRPATNVKCETDGPGRRRKQRRHRVWPPS